MSRSEVLAVTPGEPAGIGGELVLKAWAARHRAGLPPFVVLDDPDRLAKLGKATDLLVPLIPITSPAEATAHFEFGLPVLPVSFPVPVRPGHPDPANSRTVLACIERAVALAMNGSVAAVVTNPIHKGVLYRAGFPYPGHTELLGALVGVAAPVMMLAGAGLRVVPVTCHLSVRNAIARLSTEAILHCGRVTAAALRDDFGLSHPRLAVAGLNPHAGEDGAMGDEEITVIGPAIKQLRAEGIKVSGPLSADTLFHAAARARYDAALCMLHDQALIPLKTLAFDSGVNITLGLPFVRTSPDHGTAFDLAGTGRANEESLIAALKTAAEIAGRRR
ncbi:MAG: 4-hydroxythreonine-4-phosphate dehydrogenase PdxA [Rhodospirillaceae bacterium]